MAVAASRSAACGGGGCTKLGVEIRFSAAPKPTKVLLGGAQGTAHRQLSSRQCHNSGIRDGGLGVTALQHGTAAAIGMPEREHHELAFFDSVLDKVANAAKVQATNPRDPCIGHLRADARLLNEHAERGLEVFAQSLRRRRPVLRPPVVGPLDLRGGAKSNSELERHR